MDPARVGTKKRGPEALLRGKEYRVTKFIKEKSMFKSPDNQDVYKLIAIYIDLKNVKFHTFMPKEFDNPTEERLLELNNANQEGDGVRIVFYGKVDKSNIMDILMPGEVVDKEKVESLKLIEESQPTYSPIKRTNSSCDEGSPMKRAKDQ